MRAARTRPGFALPVAGTPADLPGLAARGWAATRKWDGARVLLGPDGAATRSGADATAALEVCAPGVCAWARAAGVVLDVEVVVLDATGAERPTASAACVTGRAFDGRVRLVALDALADAGRDVRDQPWTQRRDRLHRALLDAPAPVRAPVQVVGRAPSVDAAWSAARREGWEGVVVVDPGAPYLPGRSGNAVKVKRTTTTTAAVVGTTVPRGGRVPARGFSALVCAVPVRASGPGAGHGRPVLVDVGCVGAGLPVPDAAAVSAALAAGRAVVVEVAHDGWTTRADGSRRWRSPRVVAVRWDTGPADLLDLLDPGAVGAED